MTRKPGKKKPVCGIKAYGDWQYFDSKEKYLDYLLDWIAATDGAERNRAVNAMANLRAGILFTDTDAISI